MKARAIRILAWSACVAAIWLELAAVLAWIDDAPTVRDLALAFAVACVLAAVLAAGKGKAADFGSTPGDRLLAFAIALGMTLAFVEIDCRGTLTLVGGRPTCAGHGPNLSMLLTWAMAGVCLVVWPNALRAWILARFGQGR